VVRARCGTLTSSLALVIESIDITEDLSTCYLPLTQHCRAMLSHSAFIKLLAIPHPTPCTVPMWQPYFPTNQYPFDLTAHRITKSPTYNLPTQIADSEQLHSFITLKSNLESGAVMLSISSHQASSRPYSGLEA